MDSKCSPTLATLAWRHIPILIWRSSDCAWYQGCRPNGSVAGRTHRGSLSVTANSGDSQSISVYGLKFRRTDPSDSVASVSTYSASSPTSMLRRQRRTIRVLSFRSIRTPPQRGLLRTYAEYSTAGTGNSLGPSRHCGLTGGQSWGCGLGNTRRSRPPAATRHYAASTHGPGPPVRPAWSARYDRLLP